MSELHVGDRLPNGFMVLDTAANNYNSYVLAESPGNHVHRYATWMLGYRNDTYYGHYFMTIMEAMEDFKERLAGLR